MSVPRGRLSSLLIPGMDLIVDTSGAELSIRGGLLTEVRFDLVFDCLEETDCVPELHSCIRRHVGVLADFVED